MKKNKRSRALILGANGFVGRYLVEELFSNSMEVSAAYFDDAKFCADYENKLEGLYELDVTNYSDVKHVVGQARPDYIFNLIGQSSASLSWIRPTLTIDVNVNGTTNILEAIRSCGLNSRLLIVGSSDEYGAIDESQIPIKECCDLKATSPYAISKITQEMICRLYVEAYGMDIIMTRSFNHLGPGQADMFSIPSFAKKIAIIEKYKKNNILYVGNLTVSRDFTDVRDVVRAYLLLMKRGQKGEVYNVGSGKTRKLSEVVEYLIGFTNIDIEVSVSKDLLRPVDIQISQCDNSKLVKQTKWKRTISFEQSLEDTLNYWRNRV